MPPVPATRTCSCRLDRSPSSTGRLTWAPYQIEALFPRTDRPDTVLEGARKAPCPSDTSAADGDACGMWCWLLRARSARTSDCVDAARASPARSSWVPSASRLGPTDLPSARTARAAAFIALFPGFRVPLFCVWAARALCVVGWVAGGLACCAPDLPWCRGVVLSCCAAVGGGWLVNVAGCS